MNKRYLIWIAIFLLGMVPVMASWQVVPTENYLAVGNAAFINGLNIKVLDVNVEEGEATIQVINENKNTIFKGVITEDEGFEKQNFYRILAEDINYYDPARPQVKLHFEKWVRGEIYNYNFPSEVNRLDAYKVYAVVKNTGKVNTKFKLELRGEGNFHIDDTSKDDSISYRSTIRDLRFSLEKSLELKPDEKRKVYFEIQRLGEEGEYLNPEFILKSENGNIIQVVKPDSAMITSGKTGYIVDVIANQGMLSGKEEIITVKIRNSWIGASDDFYVSLVAPEFKLNTDIQKVRALNYRTEDVTFRAIPFGGGDFTVLAQLRIGNQLVDELPVDITVLGEKIYTITNTEYDTEIRPGEETSVAVTVENRNEISINTMLLTLESKDFDVLSPDSVLKLNPGTKTTAIFDIVPKRKGLLSLNAVLYDTPESSYSGHAQYNKKHKLLDSEELFIKVENEQVIVEPEKPVIKEDVETPIEEVPEEPEEPVETVEEPEEMDTSDSEITSSEYLPYVVIAILVVIALVLILTSEKPKKRKKKR